MAGIVLAVSKGPFSIFPCFPPMNGREAHQKSPRRYFLEDPLSEVRRKGPPVFERMFLRGVVIEPWF
jgi:hypothetical protein